MALPSAQYNDKNNFATIPGSQVIKKVERMQDRTNSKLNKTNKNPQ
jgi:hypothetical protein